MKAPWDHVEPPAIGERGVRNTPTPEGRELGANLARMTGEVPGACGDCAFRAGTRANGCAVSLMSAIKCVMENDPFYCHYGVPDEAVPARVCAGWAAAVAQTEQEPHA